MNWNDGHIPSFEEGAAAPIHCNATLRNRRGRGEVHHLVTRKV